MIKLSIITINYNDATGLRKTLDSVAAQTYAKIQHVIVDGNSSDASKDIIIDYVENTKNHNHEILWTSEPDKGIYNAMNKGIEIALGRRMVNSFNRSELVEDKNKGIRMATGEYIQILNSGDILFDANVTQRMIDRLEQINSQREKPVGILYGNMIKVNSQRHVVGKSGFTEYSLRQFYSSTLNHDCAYIRTDLFEEYGLYDENLKIVSDWKWYLQAIGLGRVKPEYVDIDVTIFDDGGISETNLELRNRERRQVLEELLPPAVLWDYDTHAFEMEQMNRLRRWKLYPLVYFMERVCFKLEKWGVLRR